MSDIEQSSNDEPISKDVEVDKDLALTDQNWSFLRYIEEGYKVKDAYKMAGYQGEAPNTPYDFYYRLKKKLQAIVEADSMDSLRLRVRLDKILNMPLAYEKVSVKDHLKAIELAHKITGQEKTEKPQISAFIVNRYNEPLKADVEVEDEEKKEEV